MCRVVHSFIHSLIKWQPSQLTPHGVKQCGGRGGGGLRLGLVWSRLGWLCVVWHELAQLSGQFVAGNIIFITFAFGAFIIFQQVPKINFIFIQRRNQNVLWILVYLLFSHCTHSCFCLATFYFAFAFALPH